MNALKNLFKVQSKPRAVPPDGIFRVFKEPLAGRTIELRLGSVCDQETDAIVNAANSNLEHGGGVAAKILELGGPVVKYESGEWVANHGKVPVGGVAVTSAGELPAKYCIHAVGPVWAGGTAGETDQLCDAVRNSLAKASELKCKSIALPAISTGIFGFPVQGCAENMLSTVDEYFKSHPKPGKEDLQEVRIILFDHDSMDVFVHWFDRHFGPSMDDEEKEEFPSNKGDTA